MSNSIQDLLDAAFFIEKQAALKEEIHEKSNESKCPKETLAKNTDFKSNNQRIPTSLVAEFIENTSDELRKKFSFKCKFSPDVCSKVVKSYGSEAKAFSEMKNHVFNSHLCWDSTEKLTKRKQVDKMPRPSGKTPKWKPLLSKRRSSVRTVKNKCETESNSGKSFTVPEIPIMFAAPPRTSLRADDKSVTDTLKCGQFEHSYAQAYVENPPKKPVREDGESDEHKKWVLSHLSRHMNGNSYVSPPILFDAPFPYVFAPDANNEAVQVVEILPNGDPIKPPSKEPPFSKFSTSRVSPKNAIEKKVVGEKTKLSQTASTCRSVLECVENRFTSKPNDSSGEQKDALVPNKGSENSENLEKSTQYIAWKKIQMLCKQKGKQKIKDKKSVYLCELCGARYTASMSLTYHYLRHLKIKPFKCLTCFRTFTRRHSLNYHMMIHNNKTRFHCETCNRRFRHPSHYRDHCRKHTGEEPYSCQFCSKRFKNRNSYKRHLKSSHQKILTANGIETIPNESGNES